MDSQPAPSTAMNNNDDGVIYKKISSLDRAYEPDTVEIKGNE